MVDSGTPCHHCGLAVGPHPVGSGPFFCCTGCQTVHFVLRDTGLADTFYRLQHTTANSATGRPAATDRDALLLAELDTDEFLEAHTTELEDGQRRVRLYVNGVHCAGCVWLIERLPQEMPGVRTARLDLPRSRLTLEWDPNHTTLSTVGTWLSRLGYAVQPRVKDNAEGAVQEERSLLVRVGVSWALAANIMLIAFALYAGLEDALEVDLNNAARWMSMLLAIPAVVYGATPFFRRAWSSVRHALLRRSLLHLHMDTPISIGILVGFCHSAWATISGSGAIWFDSIAVLIAALQTARWIQFRSRRIAGDAADQLLALIPTMARKANEDGSIETVTAASLRYGDIVEVPAGEIVPVDGAVSKGASHIDNAILTGESIPVRVSTGDTVWAGSTNMTEKIFVSTTAVRDESKVGKLLAWVQGDKADRAPVTMLADRLSGYFVAVVLVLAAATAVIWLRVEPGAAVSNVVALLVITCPCALGMATPLAMAVGTGRAARRGIFIRTEAAIQTLTKVSTAVLDKTGTLTYGRMSVTECIGDESAVELAALLESGSSHPIAQAIRAYALPGGDIDDSRVTKTNVTTGRGISGVVDGRRVDIGQLPWLASFTAIPAEIADTEARIAADGASPVAVAVDGTVTCILAISDEIRPDSYILLENFRSRGIDTILCSGDHLRTVQKAATELGIPHSRIYARCEPERKLAIVSDLVAHGETVAMIGDGVNDAGALQKANVGVAVSGSSVAGQISSDVFVTGRDIDAVSILFDGARNVMRVIHINLAFSLVYNLAGATAAMFGLVTPLLAAIAMPISSLIVVVLSSIQRPFS